MKKLRDKIAIETLKYTLVNKWESISIDKISKKLKINKKKISNLIKNKHDLLKNINRYFLHIYLSAIHDIDAPIFSGFKFALRKIIKMIIATYEVGPYLFP